MEPLRYINIGMNFGLQANRVWLVSGTRGKVAEDIRRAAKADGRYLDCTYGRGLRSQLMLDNGYLIGCAYVPRTIYRRLKNASVYYPDGPGVLNLRNGDVESGITLEEDIEEFDDEDENDVPVDKEEE